MAHSVGTRSFSRHIGSSNGYKLTFAHSMGTSSFSRLIKSPRAHSVGIWRKVPEGDD